MQSLTSLKIVTVGSGANGKTSLLYAYALDTFSDDYTPTVFDNMAKLAMFNDKLVSMSLADTAGQEDYARLRSLSYPNTDVILITYSLICPTTLENVKTEWIPEVKHFCPDKPYVLVGTKKDLLNDPHILQRLKERNLMPLDPNDAERIGKALGAYKSLTCSARTREGIKEVFEACIEAHFQSQISLKNTKKKSSGCILL